MATQTFTQTLIGDSAEAPSWIERFQAHRKIARHARQVAKELDSYNDRELAELGIGRADIWSLAMEDARQKVGAGIR